MSGTIYKITCASTGLSYIGQTTDYKYRDGKPYNYGPSGRWSDHVSSARTATTPLANAIHEHGRDKFVITELEKGRLDSLDELEAKWIESENTLIPFGLNVVKHSRNKHHQTSTLSKHYKGKTEYCSLRAIKNHGVNSLVYLILKMDDGSSQRLVFGQNKEHSFDDALQLARDFADELECPIEEKLDDDLATKHAELLKQLEGKTITKVQITTASKLIAVYITTSEMKSYKEKIRVCFGGKTISNEEAYLTALDFVKLLTLSIDCAMVDSISSQCPQQVTTV